MYNSYLQDELGKEKSWTFTKEGFMKEVTKGQVHKEKRDINKSIRGKIFPRQKEKYGQRIQT